jgi:hypothetical protein
MFELSQNNILKYSFNIIENTLRVHDKVKRLRLFSEVAVCERHTERIYVLCGVI